MIRKTDFFDRFDKIKNLRLDFYRRAESFDFSVSTRIYWKCHRSSFYIWTEFQLVSTNKWRLEEYTNPLEPSFGAAGADAFLLSCVGFFASLDSVEFWVVLSAAESS